MARLRFVHGTITGRLGEFVGSSWRGINYIKTFTKPSNPRTAPQRTVRTRFNTVLSFALAAHRLLMTSLIPKPKRMTLINSVMKTNTNHFDLSTVVAVKDLQFAPTTIPGNATNIQFNGTANPVVFINHATFRPNLPVEGNKLMAGAMVYDRRARVEIGGFIEEREAEPDGTYELDCDIRKPLNYNQPGGVQPNDVVLYLFFSHTDSNGRVTTSATFSQQNAD